MPESTPFHDQAALLIREGRLAEAVTTLEAMVVRDAADVLAHVLLGEAKLRAGNPTQALPHFDRSRTARWLRARAHVGRAMALQSLRRFDEALHEARLAISLEPRKPGIKLSLVTVLEASGNFVDAADVALEVLKSDPDNVDALEAARRTLIVCGRADQAVDLVRDFAAAHPDDPLSWQRFVATMTYAPNVTPVMRLQCAVQVGQWLASKVTPLPPRPVSLDPDRPLRVGYIAQDISARSAVAYFIEPIFQHHDRERYPTVCYLTQARTGMMSTRMRSHLNTWVDATDLTQDALARRIIADEIDVLVDLAGRTQGNRLLTLAHRPAPVTVSAIGDPETTGLPGLDYRFVDDATDPPGFEAHWTESLIRLPRCFLCYRPPDDAPDPRPPRPATEPISFGSFNSLVKIGPGVVSLWAAVLKSVPNSVLVLKAPVLNHPRMQAATERRFGKEGISGHRLRLFGSSPDHVDHLRHYDHVDIALDPLPYHGTTTSCEALWMGVPLVSIAGESHAGRVGVSLLRAVGLEDLIAGDRESFVRICAVLAADRSRLAELRRELRPRLSASILCDGAAHTRAVEAAFRTMWRQYISRHQPNK